MRDTDRGLEDDGEDNVGGHEPEHEEEGGVRRKAEEVWRRRGSRAAATCRVQI